MVRPISLASACNSRFHKRTRDPPEPLSKGLPPPSAVISSRLASGVARPADRLPPPANAVDGEGRGIMVDPEIDPARVGGQVINTVWHRPAELLDQEVVHPDLLRIACRTIFPAAVLEVADQFLLLRVDRDHRLVRGQRRAHHRIDVLELRIAIRVAVAFPRLAIALQAVAHPVEQLADQRAADLMALRLKLRRQPAHALARPAQPAPATLSTRRQAPPSAAVLACAAPQALRLGSYPATRNAACDEASAPAP